jgi:hypothetical protein
VHMKAEGRAKSWGTIFLIRKDVSAARLSMAIIERCAEQNKWRAEYSISGSDSALER